MQEKYIKTEYGNVYYQTTNIDKNKHTLFFLHGMTGNHTMFEPQIVHFKKNYNIIAWDAPSHGKSRPYSLFSYENMSKVMYDILKELNIKNVILIGQSMGGFIAQSFLFRHPEMVIGFIAIDSCPFGEYYSKFDILCLKQIEWMSKLFPEKLLRYSMVKQNSISDIGQSNMKKMISIYSKKELCHLMGMGYIGFLEDNRSFDITCPTLLLVGEKDRTGKVKKYNKEWSSRTGIKRIMIPNAAHNSNMDNPEKVNQYIEEFIENLE